MNKKLLPLLAGCLLVIVTSFSHAEPLPDAWASQDVGEVNHKGGVDYDGENYKINGSGAEIWDSSDSFHFMYQPLEKDGTIIAHFKNGLNFVDPFAKAGIMIRSNLDANSANVFLAVTSQNGAILQKRLKEGNPTAAKLMDGKFSSAVGGSGLWLKLEREGDIITASTSEDGADWSEVESISTDFPEKIFIGLAMTSHDAAQQYGFATFGSVEVATLGAAK